MLVVVVLIFGRLHQRTIENELAEDAVVGGNGNGHCYHGTWPGS